MQVRECSRLISEQIGVAIGDESPSLANCIDILTTSICISKSSGGGGTGSSGFPIVVCSWTAANILIAQHDIDSR